MIYFDENTKIIKIPKVVGGNISKIRFENQLTHLVIEQNVSEISNNGSYYSVYFTPSNQFIIGQYDYQVINTDGETTEIGLAQYGEFEATNTQYESENNIIVYGE